MKEIFSKLEAILDKDLPLISNLSNASSVIFSLPDLNWCGFYLLEGETLYLGPFQGEPACTKIRVGHGVCGTAVQERKTIVVDDVNQFKGHIACSSLSKSEIVVPLFKEGKIIGVLDIDAPIYSRFKTEDIELIEECAHIIEKIL